MSKQVRQKPPVADPIIGKSVRIKGECVVLAHYPAAASVPDRVMVRVGDLTTVVPAERIEVVQ